MDSVYCSACGHDYPAVCTLCCEAYGCDRYLCLACAVPRYDHGTPGVYCPEHIDHIIDAVDEPSAIYGVARLVAVDMARHMQTAEGRLAMQIGYARCIAVYLRRWMYGGPHERYRAITDIADYAG